MTGTQSFLGRLEFYLSMLAMLVGLGSCGNHVITDVPLLSRSHDARSVVFRDGIWLGGDKCSIGPNGRLDKKECSGVARITGRHFEFIVGDPTKRDDNLSFSYRVVGGDVIIAQLQPFTSAAGVKRSKEQYEFSKMSRYLYAGIRVLARDQRGRITKLRYWGVPCGPPGPKPSSEERLRHGVDNVFYRPETPHPFPGMIMEGGRCGTTSMAALVSATHASESWGEGMVVTWMARDFGNFRTILEP